MTSTFLLSQTVFFVFFNVTIATQVLLMPLLTQLIPHCPYYYHLGKQKALKIAFKTAVKTKHVWTICVTYIPVTEFWFSAKHVFSWQNLSFNMCKTGLANKIQMLSKYSYYLKTGLIVV
ncbi:UNVERIFIED_CONTAM: hypothetical protein K2H54_038667 [Gekko kuhli]